MPPALLRPSDVPAFGADRPDAGALLVGAPDAAIGRVRWAWTNARADRRRVFFSAPAVALGVLFSIPGLLLGLSLVDRLGPGAPPPLLMLAGGALTGGLAFGAAVLVVNRWSPRSIFVGDEGMQENAVRGGKVESVITRFAEHWMLFTETRTTLLQSGRVAGTVDTARLDLVPREGGPGAPSRFVPPDVHGPVRAVMAARRRSSADGVHPIFAGVGASGAARIHARRGHVACLPEGLALSDGSVEKRAGWHELRAAIRDGALDFVWRSDRARVPLGEIADVDVLLERLSSRGVLGQG